MSLKKELQEELKKALKEKNKIRLETIRSIINGIKNFEINNKIELDDNGIIKIINTLAKQRRDSIEQFEKGGRQDLADKEKQELEILLSFLPEQLSENEIEKIVKQTIEEIGATSLKELGKVMKAVMPKVQGKADGKIVNQIVKKLLEQ